MWPEDVKICDPSKLTVPCSKEILQLWRGRQQIGGASHTFRFSFFIEDKKLSTALYDLSQQASTAAPNTRIGSVAPLATAAPIGTLPVGGRLSPNTLTVSTAAPNTRIVSVAPLAIAAPIGTLPVGSTPVPNTRIGSVAPLATAVGGRLSPNGSTASTPAPNTKNIGSVAPLATAEPIRRVPALSIEGHLSPNALTSAHPSSTRPRLELETISTADPHMDPICPTPTSLTQTLIGSRDQSLDPPTVPNAPSVTMPTATSVDGPESDLPIVRKKGKQTARRSESYSSDPTTQDETVKRRRGPRKSTRNFALEDAMDRNSEGAAPSIISRNQSTSKGHHHRSNKKSAAHVVELQKACPKPRPITKQPGRQGPTSAEEQRNIEDGLFIRKSTRT